MLIFLYFYGTISKKTIYSETVFCTVANRKKTIYGGYYEKICR